MSETTIVAIEATQPHLGDGGGGLARPLYGDRLHPGLVRHRPAPPDLRADVHVMFAPRSAFYVENHS